MYATYFGFVEELSEAASWVLLRMWGHLEDELHDNNLVGHLFHQSFFLQDKTKNKGTLNALLLFDFTGEPIEDFKWQTIKMDCRQCRTQTKGCCL